VKRNVLSTGIRAGAVAAAVSGIPSTVVALVGGRDVLEATEAAGTILLPHEGRRARLVVAAIPIHLATSLLWASLLSAVLPRKRTVAAGAAAGLAVALLDLGVLARRFPQVSALPLGPQIVDHLVFGVTAAAVIRGRRARVERGYRG
jgi:hypothetical protein